MHCKALAAGADTICVWELAFDIPMKNGGLRVIYSSLHKSLPNGIRQNSRKDFIG